MKPDTAPGYGDAPLGMECALPGGGPRLAKPATPRTGLWRRMVYRFKYGLKISARRRAFRTA